ADDDEDRQRHVEEERESTEHDADDGSHVACHSPVATGGPHVFPPPQGDDPANQGNDREDQPYYGYAAQESEIARGNRVSADPGRDEEFRRLDGWLRRTARASWAIVVIISSASRSFFIVVGALVRPRIFIQFIVGRHESPG